MAKICNSCQVENNDNAKFCSECGAKFEDKKLCPVCSAEVKPTDKFCENCGYNLIQKGEEDVHGIAKDNITEENEEQAPNPEEILINELGKIDVKSISDYYVRGKSVLTKSLWKKISAGIKSFGNGIDFSDIIAYYDSTLFGGGDEGFILTKDRILFKRSFSDPSYVYYSSIIGLDKTFGGFNIKTTDEKMIEICCTSDSIRTEIMKSIYLIIFDNIITNQSKVIFEKAEKIKNEFDEIKKRFEKNTV